MRDQANRRFLLLVPRRFIGHRLAEQVGADARTAFHQEALEYQLVQERFALGLLVADPDDRVALRAWLGFHSDRAEHEQARNAPAYSSIRDSAETGTQLVAQVAAEEIVPTGRGRTHVQARCQRLIAARAEVPAGLVDQIEFVFNPELANALEDEEKRRWVAEDLRELRAAGLALADEEEVPLSSVLGRLAYRIATRAPLSDAEDEPRVSIMTLHSAKGLEADTIVLAGLADQIIPGLSQGDERAEQRRLLYVAITRARDELVLSWARSVLYAEAMRNQIRRDQVRTIGDQRRVVLSRTTLFPAGLPDPMLGGDWLNDQ